MKIPKSVQDLNLFQAAALAGFRSASALAREAQRLTGTPMHGNIVASMMRGSPGYSAARKALQTTLDLTEAELETLIRNGAQSA